jgi:hypothetical protein
MNARGPIKTPRNRLARLLVAFPLAAYLSMIPAVAHAGWAESAVGWYTNTGHNYQSYAAVNTSPGTVYAYTYAGPRDFTAPAGWIGLRARIMNTAGSVVAESSNVYTPQSLTAGSYWSAYLGRSLTGTWYSWGVTYAWNGSSYDAYLTFKSPYQTS